ncbi:hypothetical protein DFH29DRAFT_998467 [Suillus ampliporus]|nr:hypothetical protein DFH29DRAFT_998467 [Suillus ampliporus]
MVVTPPPKAKPQLSTSSTQKLLPTPLVPGPGRFTISSLAALHTSTFTQGFSNNECQAAARALLRHDTHIDGTHYHTRKPAGLHPAYAAFNWTNGKEGALTHVELIKAMLQDLFDAVTMQDHIDGGISLLI